MSEDLNSDPVELGDGRSKYITLVTSTGEHFKHEASYLRHSTDEFIISTDESFSQSATTRYSKSDISYIEINQHHSRCFITTAVTNDRKVLQSLRDFRDDVLVNFLAGRGLIELYEIVSPPIADTLAQNPGSSVTLLVEKLVTCCARLATLRSESSSPYVQTMLTLLLVVLYVLGMSIGVCGHLGIQYSKRASPLKQ